MTAAPTVVGISDLKARLSEYLRRAGRGEGITVTRRGRPIAQIVPVDGGTGVQRGLREGWITRGEDRPPSQITRQWPLADTPTTTELIRAGRDA